MIFTYLTANLTSYSAYILYTRVVLPVFLRGKTNGKPDTALIWPLTRKWTLESVSWKQICTEETPVCSTERAKKEKGQRKIRNSTR